MPDSYEPIPYAVTRNKYDKLPTVHFSEALTMEDNLAFQLVCKWGMITAVDDGEDSAGRAKMRGETPTEMVERALSTAEIFYSRIRELGWTVKVGLPLTEPESEAATG
jgi:hypothetical protein